MPINGKDQKKILKVLHTLGFPGGGGIEKLVLDLAGVQSRDPDIDVAVLFQLTSGTEDAFADAYEQLGVPLYHLNLTSGYDFSPVKFRQACKIFDHFDVIQLHVFNPLVVLAAARSNCRLIYTEHGTFGKGRKQRISDRINRQLLRLFLNKRADVVTFNSRWTETAARKIYGLDKVDTALVYNGIALPNEHEFFGEVDDDTKTKIAGKFVIGTTSRFAGFKRIDRLIDAFAKFETGKDSILLLVGDGILRSQLESQVADLGLSERVIFTGFRTNVRAYQNAMDICVFPSTGEPFGLVSVEALSLGKPVLVFADCGGMREVVEPIAPDDVVANIDAMAKRLQQYYSRRATPDLNIQLRIDHAQRFGVDGMAEGFKSNYSDAP